jgi:hypothetical protein
MPVACRPAEGRLNVIDLLADIELLVVGPGDPHGLGNPDALGAVLNVRSRRGRLSTLQGREL